MKNQDSMKSNNKVLVIGGGVGGLKAAMDLSEAGRDVLLIDKAPSLGGLMTQLDRTFPTNNCDLCTLSPRLAESDRQRHIDFMTLTQLNSVVGRAGQFRVRLKRTPRFIDTGKCTACGDCYQQFPECVRFTPGLDHRAPTCMRYPQATPEAFSIDIEKCRDIEALVKVCGAEAIIPQDREEDLVVEVGAIILALGADLFDAGKLTTYEYGKCPDVVTGMEYERILSASGPTGGELLRPSDGKPPKKIAWIQCAGSRSINREDVPYCSSACCMYALKEATVTKERFHDEIETVVFYMDMRTFGKDYELYYQRAREEFGIRFEQCRPHSVELRKETNDLAITYTSNGTNPINTEFFDMVVLATGFCVSKDATELADKLGVELDRHRFVKTSDFSPVSTSMPGVYVCGVCGGPKDIPETMIEASAAACMASKDLATMSIDSETETDLPPERDVSGEEPRIGVFVCDCGQEIGGVIDVESLVAYAGTLPCVTHAEAIGHGCSRESLARIRDSALKDRLNRVVIGACSPRTHERLFRDNMRRVGLNKYLLEMANIRDQDAWVHADDPQEATYKAQDLIRMTAASAALSRPLTEHALPMNKDILVVGGGITGMNAALSLAEQGYKVFLAERARELGGTARHIHRTLEGMDVKAYVNDLISKVTQHALIQVLTNAVVVDHTGMPGMFKTGLQVGPRMYYRQITHGATILATGALAHRPKEYLLDEHPAVVTQLDLDGIIERDPGKIKTWRNVVMIQCVGSRSPENPNCSRVCCQTAVKNALQLKNLNPEIRIFVLYRDMRTYGLQEDYYRTARERGIIFVHYRPEGKPIVAGAGEQVVVTFDDPVLARSLAVTADCLALSTGFLADDEMTEDLGVIFRLPRTADGYFLEDHVKLRPVDLPVPGFYVAGTAHSPRSLHESIAQAQAAAARSLTMLAKDEINLGASVARVDSTKCAACLICVRACPFGIPFINADGYSEIDPAKCHGCGVCAADCPARAIQLMQFEDDQILAQVDGLFEGMP